MDLLAEQPPRSEETVGRLAGPVDTAERRTRRGIGIYTLLLVGAVAVLAFLPVPGFIAPLVAGIGGLYPVIYFFAAIVPGAVGHGATIVREGIAYPAKVDTKLGAKGDTSWVVDWNDATNQHRRVLVPSGRGTKPNPDAVVLVVDRLKFYGVVINDRLYVLGRGSMRTVS